MKKITLSTIAGLITAIAFAQNVGIGTKTPVNKLTVVDSITSEGHATIFVKNKGIAGRAIYAISDSVSSYGIKASSQSNFAINASSDYSTAIKAGALGGTALAATCLFGGYALEVDGNVRLTGLNTAPRNGAELTSDAVGNADWKPKRIGFSANTAVNTVIPYVNDNVHPANVPFTKVEFNTEEYDLQNNFIPYAGSTTSSSSVFTAPVAGIYHIYSAVTCQTAMSFYGNIEPASSGIIRLVKNSPSTILSIYEVKHSNSGSSSNLYVVNLLVDGDFHLAANDRVWIEVGYRNNHTTTVSLNTRPERGMFNCILKIAD